VKGKSLAAGKMLAALAKAKLASNAEKTKAKAAAHAGVKDSATDKQIMSQARKQNMHLKLKTLLERPDISEQQLATSVVFRALQDSTGNVLAARRALLHTCQQEGGNTSRSPPAKKDKVQSAARGTKWMRLAAKKRKAPRCLVPSAKVDDEDEDDDETSALSRCPSVALQKFLNSPAGVTTDAAAFQLRCKQTSQVRSEETGEVRKVVRKVVVVVGGRTKLWKLNQTIAECFEAADGEFSHSPNAGTTVLGSRFIVSRPLKPGVCDKVLICSARSAAHVGSHDAAAPFVDDRSFSVAQLFRGTSTRTALVRKPSEAAQRVSFASPKLGSEVSIFLDGIMLPSYDSRNLFDKKRRHSNGWRPLPRIVRSSNLLKVEEIEAKNIVMQGDREGPDYLLKMATPWSDFHSSSRRSQRKPLFRKDGRDYDLHDLCYVSGDEETDSDADCPSDAE